MLKHLHLFGCINEIYPVTLTVFLEQNCVVLSGYIGDLRLCHYCAKMMAQYLPPEQDRRQSSEDINGIAVPSDEAPARSSDSLNTGGANISTVSSGQFLVESLIASCFCSSNSVFKSVVFLLWAPLNTSFVLCACHFPCYPYQQILSYFTYLLKMHFSHFERSHVSSPNLLIALSPFYQNNLHLLSYSYTCYPAFKDICQVLSVTFSSCYLSRFVFRQHIDRKGNSKTTVSWNRIEIVEVLMFYLLIADPFRLQLLSCFIAPPRHLSKSDKYFAGAMLWAGQSGIRSTTLESKEPSFAQSISNPPSLLCVNELYFQHESRPEPDVGSILVSSENSQVQKYFFRTASEQCFRMRRSLVPIGSDTWMLQMYLPQLRTILWVVAIRQMSRKISAVPLQ